MTTTVHFLIPSLIFATKSSPALIPPSTSNQHKTSASYSKKPLSGLTSSWVLNFCSDWSNAPQLYDRKTSGANMSRMRMLGGLPSWRHFLHVTIPALPLLSSLKYSKHSLRLKQNGGGRACRAHWGHGTAS
eukprot:CAMPEP_0114153110 /NCGR_PEP_ID=MMETSP0043_2-20121206/24175_1 /TAXON_ID=464988 /ORGANISM="Hemiselmis andersenii, Strain CCMP644" /LENGTH=130 /DNA_ID=CAMNT_0001248113 /DNA_START=31 /DNA_END=423 /DNA_ORIENTATION=+